MDVLTVIGLTLGAGCVLLGQALEGGTVGSLFQLTAAIIVLGGTAGAVLTQFPWRTFAERFASPVGSSPPRPSRSSP